MNPHPTQTRRASRRSTPKRPPHLGHTLAFPAASSRLDVRARLLLGIDFDEAEDAAAGGRLLLLLRRGLVLLRYGNEIDQEIDLLLTGPDVHDPVLNEPDLVLDVLLRRP